MYLPGTPGDRVADLRSSKGWNQKELAQKIGLSASQVSRIERGETKSVSSDILIKLAKEFQVSTDYILGLTAISVPKSYDISELGLSEKAVESLVTGAVDVEILNRLLGHRNFPHLIGLIRIYFEDTAASVEMLRNLQAVMADRPLEKITMDDIASAIVAEIKKAVQLDEETMERFKSLMIQIMKQTEDGTGQKEPEKHTADSQNQEQE